MRHRDTISAGNPISRRSVGMWQASSPCQRQAGLLRSEAGLHLLWQSLPTPQGTPPREQGQRASPLHTLASASCLWEVMGPPGTGSPQGKRRARRSRPLSPQMCDHRPWGWALCISPGRTFQTPAEWLLANGRTGNRAGQLQGPWGGEGQIGPGLSPCACPETRTSTVSGPGPALRSGT